MLGGCHHLTPHEAPALHDELSAVTADELFALAVSQARQGDLLRAEHYFSAARQKGYDEAAVLYWLVRVCISGGRYQSALGHASEYLRDHPHDWSLRLVVASIYEALGDLARARHELELIVWAEPNQALPRYRLAVLYRTWLSDAELARPHLQAYLTLSPGGPHAAEVTAALDEETAILAGPRLVPHPSATGETSEAGR
jgi:tetratricopeptide (TPR) repeat protein